MGADGSKSLTQSDIEHLKSNTRFSSKEIQEWHDKFHEDFPGGVIKEAQFIDMYARMCPKGDSRQFAKNVFHAYDKDGNGEIDFHEFMVTLSVSSRGTPTEKLKWAFNMYDTDKNGVVSMDEVIDMITAIYRMKGDYDKSRVEDAAQKIFLHLDKNKDGELSQEEFITGAQRSNTIMSVLQGE